MDFKDKIISVIPLILIVLFVYIFTTFISDSFQKNVIQDNLMWITPIFLAVILFLVVFSFFWCLKDLKKILKKIDKKTWIILLVILIVGLSLRTFVAPHVQRILYDEDLYLNIGQNIVMEGKAANCNYGTQDECFSLGYNKQPNGYPFLMSILFLFTGTSETSAHYATAIISSLTILMVFFIAYLLFKNEKISLFSALIFALIPIAIRWAPTTSAGTVFIFFTGLTVFAFLFYLKNGKNRALLFSLASLAYTIQIRPEGILLFGVVILMFLFFKKDVFDSLRKKEFLIILIVFSILIVPHLLHMDSVKLEKWGAEEEKLGIEHIDENLEDNSMFFFENTRFPVAFTVFSLIGLALRKAWKEKIFLGLWFLSFFVLYLLFYAGGFNYGVDVRFSLSLYIPIAILGGCGAFLIADRIYKIFIFWCFPRIKRFKNEHSESTGKKSQHVLSKHFKMTKPVETITKCFCFGIVAFVIIASFLPFIPLVSSVGEESWSARLANEFIKEKMEDMDDDCWIFTPVAAVVLNNGKNAVNANFAHDKNIVKKIFDETSCVFFYEEYWCASEPWKTYISKYFHDNFNLIPYDSVTKTEMGFTRTFTLYYIADYYIEG